MKEDCDIDVDAKWTFSAKYMYDPAVYNACMPITALHLKLSNGHNIWPWELNICKNFKNAKKF